MMDKENGIFVDMDNDTDSYEKNIIVKKDGLVVKRLKALVFPPEKVKEIQVISARLEREILSQKKSIKKTLLRGLIKI